jgi:DNA-binding transcriptional LysR family regulator
VEVSISEEFVDLAAGGFDAGVRLGQFIAADMVAVRLSPPFPLIVVGGQDYLRGRKRPESIGDLRQHACLRMRRSNGAIAPWSFVSGKKAIEVIVSGPFTANDYPSLIGAAIQNMGLAQVPAPVAAEQVKAGKLIQVLAPFAPMAPGVFLYYPHRHQTLPKLRAFIAHIKSRSGEKNQTSNKTGRAKSR